jgi:hypothetical protein
MLGFQADETQGKGRMIAEPTGSWDQAAPEAPVATTPSALVRDVT